MPQLDVVAYLTQYIWTLISLLLLFSFVVLGLLPKIQQQLALRAQAEASFKDNIVLADQSKMAYNQNNSSLAIYKAILNLD